MSSINIKGPFEDLPQLHLPPLTTGIATYLAKRKDPRMKDDPPRVPLNPFSNSVEEFMNKVPTVEEGAFAFLAISGDILGGSVFD